MRSPLRALIAALALLWAGFPVCTAQTVRVSAPAAVVVLQVPSRVVVNPLPAVSGLSSLPSRSLLSQVPSVGSLLAPSGFARVPSADREASVVKGAANRIRSDAGYPSLESERAALESVAGASASDVAGELDSYFDGRRIKESLPAGLPANAVRSQGHEGRGQGLPSRTDVAAVEVQAQDASQGNVPSAQRTVSLPGTEDKRGQELLILLHEISGRGQRTREYSDAHRYMFSTADNVTVGGVRGVVDPYSQIFVAGTGEDGGGYPERGDQNGDGQVDRQGMNAEHIWPQSFFDKRLPMRSDLHHLVPTFVTPNSMRGNLPFGEVRGSGEYSNNAGAKVGQGVFEPPDAAKGKVARALLYFYVRYYDRNITNGAYGENFWNSKLEMLLRWNRTYPPDDNERRRNDLIERFQGNRNPFIDDPALADRVGVEGLRRASRWDMAFRNGDPGQQWPRRHRQNRR